MLLNSFDNFEIPEYVIIGSGPAGITLANELEKKNKKILLLEAGGKEFSEESQDFYKGNVTGDKYYDLDVARLRFLGGSSNHWAGNCAPLDDYDFLGWSIKSKDLNVYENRAKEILNLNGEFIKYQDTILKSFKLTNMLKSDVNFNEKYNKKILNSKNIYLFLNAYVTHFTFLKDSKKIDNINLFYKNEKKRIKLHLYTKVILSCGGIENSRILLWTKENDEYNFLNNLHIGRYWMEHPTGEIGQFLGEEKKLRKILFKDSKFVMFVPSKEFLKTEKLNNIRFRIAYWVKTPIKNIKFFVKEMACIAPIFSKKVIEKLSNNIVHCLSVINFSSEQLPDFENKITLSKFNFDKYGIPRVNIKWQIKEDVFITIKKCLERFAIEAIDNDLGRVGIDKYVYEKSFKNSNDIFSNYHHMGGTIMSDNTKRAVVDNNLKVIGLNNLYVLGSSVFAKSGHFNPTFTIVQLSLKLADYLLKNDKL